MNAVRLVGGLGAATALAWSARAARRRRVSEREAALFRRINDAPDQLEAPAWLVMQSGSLAAAFAAAAVTERRRGAPEALVVLAVGAGVWAAVKLVKPAVGRGRPARHLEGVVVRGRPQSGLGYPSGHAAVSTALALVAPDLGRWRLPALVVAALVGCSRVYMGAHLPLDVAGGLAIGALAGVAGNAKRSMLAGPGALRR